MYSTNTNNQQDRGRQAPNVKPAPKGGQTMKDMFTATPAEREIIERIAKRACALYHKYGNTDVDELDIQMDLEACHCNGCPLRLADMEQADAFNLMHDVTGINMHLNRNTGELSKRFLPRFFDASKEGRRHE